MLNHTLFSCVRGHTLPWSLSDRGKVCPLLYVCFLFFSYSCCALLLQLLKSLYCIVLWEHPGGVVAPFWKSFLCRFYPCIQFSNSTTEVYLQKNLETSVRQWIQLWKWCICESKYCNLCKKMNHIVRLNVHAHKLIDC